MTTNMQYFLIIYNRRTGETKIETVFPAERRAAAMRQRFRLERQFRDQSDVEVVVLGSESEDSLRHTHARYFKSFSEIASAI